MSVTANKLEVNLRLLLDAGVDPDTGKAISRTKTFSNIRGEATDDGIFSAAQALSSLQTHSVKSVQKQDIYELSNQ